MAIAVESSENGSRPTPEHRDRRSLIRKAALAGGALWLAAGIRAEPAFAHTNVFDGFIDVTSDGYNADPTGTTDAEPAISTAITDASNATPNPKSIYFPPGRYRIDVPLLLPSNTRLIGHPRESVIFAGAWVGTLIRNQDDPGNPGQRQVVNDIYIDGLSLDGNGRAGFGIVINASEPCRRIVVRRVEIHDGRSRYDGFVDIDGDGRFGEDERNRDIDGDGRVSELEPPGQDLDGDGRFGENEQDLDGDGRSFEFENGASFAIRLGANECSVENCEVHDWGRDGIHVGGSRNVVRANIVRDCNDDHIAINGDRNVVVGNIIIARRTGWGGSVACRASSRTKVLGNLLYGSVRGVEITGSSTPEFGFEIDVSGNMIVETGNVDAPVGTPQAPDVCNAICPGWGNSQGSGVNVMAGAAGSQPTALRSIKITNNVISAPRNHGIQVIRPSGVASKIEDVLIAGNQILLDQGASYLEGNVGSGIACLYTAGGIDAGITEGVRIRGNDIRGALGPGIKISGGTQRRFDVQDNRILDSGRSSSWQPGILLDGVDRALVANNRAHDTRATAQKTQMYGLQVFNPRDDLSLLGNVFTGHTLDGSGNDTVIAVAGSTTVTRLRIRDNVGFNPWTGRVTLGGALSQGPVQIGSFRYWWKEVQITFGDPPGFALPFPSDAAVNVIVTTNRAAYTAVAFDVKRTGFKCRVFAAANNADTPAPTQSDDVTVYWRAEPVD